MTKADAFESRSFRMGGILVGGGTIMAGLIFGFPYGITFLAGGILSALNMAMLRHSINTVLRRQSNRKTLTIGSYLLRLLLIPLCLYAIMRLFFLGLSLQLQDLRFSVVAFSLRVFWKHSKKALDNHARIIAGCEFYKQISL